MVKSTVDSKGREGLLFELDLARAKECFERQEYISSLVFLDRITERTKLPLLRYLRALLRENVNDLTGSLRDVRCRGMSFDYVLTKARVKAKLGFVEEAASALRLLLKNMTDRDYAYWEHLATVICGRRFDLELLKLNNIPEGKMPRMEKSAIGSAIEHFIALGEFDVCRRLFGGVSDSEFSLLSIAADIEKADELSTVVANCDLSSHVEQTIMGIRGWFSTDEAKLVASLAAKVPSEYTIVEVGSFQGRSTCALSIGATMGSFNSVHAVDTFSGLPGIFDRSTLSILQRNLISRNLSENVIIHKGKSAEIARNWKDKKIGLLLIDANHDYESVKNDYKVWLPHLSSDGLIVFHDSNQPGPNRFLCEITQKRLKGVRPLGLRDSLFIMRLSEHERRIASVIKENTWLKYLEILGQNYSHWAEREKVKLHGHIMDLFDEIKFKFGTLPMLNSSICRFGDSTKKETNNAQIELPTTVVDVTYRCNASCMYCQWSNDNNRFKKHLPLRVVLLSTRNIKALGTKRLVLSGGEPRLHPKLPRMLSYYRRIVDSLIVMSNGYGLNKQELSQLMDYGATGVSVSLDSTSANESMLTKGTPYSVHRQIISNLMDICENKKDFELGINSTISHVTANWETVRKILELGLILKVDYVKFQPIFDDGYVKMNAPYLMLTNADVPELLKISNLLESIEHPLTNPPSFWKNIAYVAEGKKLSPESCGVGYHNSIAIRGNLSICYWLSNASFGETHFKLKPEDVCRVRDCFELSKLKCKVGFHCFCTQNISHVWKERAGSD